MKKRNSLLLMAIILTVTVFTGCGNTNTVSEDVTETVDVASVEVETATPAPTEEPHEHAYAEEITTPVTCEADGVKTFTCECGDTYTEVITATGHIFENYISNEDATYTADGTETSKCSNCDVTDTRTAEGSMLTYTYTDMDAIMYAQKSVNVRSLPNTDGEKLGGLNQNDEVHVTGQCVETGWYRFEYNGDEAFAIDGYLGADKAVVQQPSEPSEEDNTETEGYSIVMKNGYRYVNKVVADYNEALVALAAVGYPAWQLTDNGGTDISISVLTGSGGGEARGNDYWTYWFGTFRTLMSERGCTDCYCALWVDKDNRINIELADGTRMVLEIWQAY